jgi:hypothetical protein
MDDAFLNEARQQPAGPVALPGGGHKREAQAFCEGIHGPSSLAIWAANLVSLVRAGKLTFDGISGDFARNKRLPAGTPRWMRFSTQIEHPGKAGKKILCTFYSVPSTLRFWCGGDMGRWAAELGVPGHQVTREMRVQAHQDRVGAKRRKIDTEFMAVQLTPQQTRVLETFENCPEFFEYLPEWERGGHMQGHPDLCGGDPDEDSAEESYHESEILLSPADQLETESEEPSSSSNQAVQPDSPADLHYEVEVPRGGESSSIPESAPEDSYYTIRNWPDFTCPADVRQFLGVIGYVAHTFLAPTPDPFGQEGAEPEMSFSHGVEILRQRRKMTSAEFSRTLHCPRAAAAFTYLKQHVGEVDSQATGSGLQFNTAASINHQVAAAAVRHRTATTAAPAVGDVPRARDVAILGNDPPEHAGGRKITKSFLQGAYDEARRVPVSDSPLLPADHAGALGSGRTVPPSKSNLLIGSGVGRGDELPDDEDDDDVLAALAEGVSESDREDPDESPTNDEIYRGQFQKAIGKYQKFVQGLFPDQQEAATLKVVDKVRQGALVANAFTDLVLLAGTETGAVRWEDVRELCSEQIHITVQRRDEVTRLMSALRSTDKQVPHPRVQPGGAALEPRQSTYIGTPTGSVASSYCAYVPRCELRSAPVQEWQLPSSKVDRRREGAAGFFGGPALPQTRARPRGQSIFGKGRPEPVLVQPDPGLNYRPTGKAAWVQFLAKHANPSDGRLTLRSGKKKGKISDAIKSRTLGEMLLALPDHLVNDEARGEFLYTTIEGVTRENRPGFRLPRELIPDLPLVSLTKGGFRDKDANSAITGMFPVYTGYTFKSLAADAGYTLDDIKFPKRGGGNYVTAGKVTASQSIMPNLDLVRGMEVLSDTIGTCSSVAHTNRIYEDQWPDLAGAVFLALVDHATDVLKAAGGRRDKPDRDVSPRNKKYAASDLTAYQWLVEAAKSGPQCPHEKFVEWFRQVDEYVRMEHRSTSSLVTSTAALRVNEYVEELYISSLPNVTGAGKRDIMVLLHYLTSLAQKRERGLRTNKGWEALKPLEHTIVREAFCKRCLMADHEFCHLMDWVKHRLDLDRDDSDDEEEELSPGQKTVLAYEIALKSWAKLNKTSADVVIINGKLERSLPNKDAYLAAASSSRPPKMSNQERISMLETRLDSRISPRGGGEFGAVSNPPAVTLGSAPPAPTTPRSSTPSVRGSAAEC